MDDILSHIEDKYEYKKFLDANTWSTYLKTTREDLKIVHLNIRSLRKKFNELLILLERTNFSIDILLLSEINIRQAELPLYCIDGYDMHGFTRENRRGGGLLVYFKNELRLQTVNPQSCGLEILHSQLKSSDTTIHIITVYKPPNTNKLCCIQELSVLIKQIPEYEDVIIAGDMNINLLEKNATTDKYKNAMYSYGMQSVINDCTREEILAGRLVTSCIDHVWVRTRSRRFASHMFTCKLSDHYMVGVSITKESKGVNRISLTSGNYKMYTLNNKVITRELEQVDWSKLVEIDCPLIIYEQLCNVFAPIYDKAKVSLNGDRKKRVIQPWISKKIKILIDKRDYLFRRWKTSPQNVTYRLEYTKHRNQTNKIINKAKNNYRRQELSRCQGDFRKLWETINCWLGNSKNSLDDVVIKYLGKINSLSEICSKFSETFTKEINKIKHQCNIKFLNRESYVKSSDTTFYYKKVTEIEIKKIISQLNSKKSPGLDGIRPQDLILVKEKISPILAKFVNLSFKTGLYPDSLKKSIIRPVYKQGDHCNYSNYRPIAILSVINKIVEKVIVKRLSEYLEKNCIITEKQHGFRKLRSTTTALSIFTDDINECLGSKQYVFLLFIDFKKAFDTLDHEQLLVAMEECGIRGPISSWFRNYLHNRMLCTKIKETICHGKLVSTGVPTGSVFGPVGYIMHVNSMVNVVKNCRTYMYADDTCMMYADRDIKVIENKIQSDFDNVIKWSHDNGIILNIEKTKCMLIQSPYLHKPCIPINIIGHSYDCLHRNKQCIGCKSIELVDNYKYLGLTIDTKFSWNFHIERVCNKLRSLLCKFVHLKSVVDKTTLRVLYYALVDSVINYGLSAYGRTFRTYMDRIHNLQLRFIKLLVSKQAKEKSKGNYNLLFKKCNILPVREKTKYLLAIEGYKSKFLVRKSIYGNLRKNTRKLFEEPSAQNYFGERTRRYLVPRIFNENVPQEACRTKQIFKNKLKYWLLNAIDDL